MYCPKRSIIGNRSSIFSGSGKAALVPAWTLDTIPDTSKAWSAEGW